MALYEPGYGYYVTGPAKMGWEGDYYTSTDVSPFFANCMGRQLKQMWEQLGSPSSFPVLEQGAGRRHLAQGVRAWAEQVGSAFSVALDYRTEDIHAGQDVVSGPEGQDTSAPSGVWCPVVLLSNELVDAFPVHIVELREAKLYEIYVDFREGRLCEVLSEPSSAAVASYLDGYKIPWAGFGDGWRAEINLDALRWMERTAQLLRDPLSKRTKHGFVLAIDYGDKARALYSRYRQRGTLACYFQHQLTERPLLRPGEQDITAHVNFSALIQAGRGQGLRLHRLTTQGEWLTSLGIYEELEQIRTRDFAVIDSARATDEGQKALFQWYNLRQRVAALTDPAGMGNFKVLILKR